MACPVCFSPIESAARSSLNVGIGVMLVVTGLVLGGVGAFLASLVRRARRGMSLPAADPGRS
ncbi:MAG: hypothetical protein HOP14_08220 [Acidobacteria bacterium]|nr:hypothetical protein [Acidobacteriota bacterium]